ncbi:MAG: hypothetical protein OEW66_12300, partial [Actinomycetota bacterium]|nr:hypothetical protein [Actinomycetota bacterium]
MPRGPLAISFIQVFGLWVSMVLVIVPTAVTQVDPTDERDIAGVIARMTDQHQLLVMGTGSAYPLVEHDQSAIAVHGARQLHVVFHMEAGELGVRSPDQASNRDSSPSTIR